MDFINYGVPTADGQRVLAHMRAQCEMAEARGIDALNGLAGHVAYYYVNVHKTGFLTEADWLKAYPNAATAAYLDLQQIEEAQAKAQQAEANQTTLAENLEALKAQLTDALDRLAKLEADKVEPAAAPEVETAAEPAAAPVESKKPRKPAPAEADAETEA